MWMETVSCDPSVLNLNFKQIFAWHQWATDFAHSLCNANVHILLQAHLRCRNVCPARLTAPTQPEHPLMCERWKTLNKNLRHGLWAQSARHRIKTLKHRHSRISRGS